MGIVMPGKGTEMFVKNMGIWYNYAADKGTE